MGAIRDAAHVVAEWPSWFGGPVTLRSASVSGLDLLVLDAPHLYARPGNPYVDASGRDWPDNAERFAALAATAARIGRGAVDGDVPDVIHAHDWQTALVPAYLRFVDADGDAPATVLTIHNLAFQGRFAADAVVCFEPSAIGDRDLSARALEVIDILKYSIGLAARSMPTTCLRIWSSSPRTGPPGSR